MRQDRTHAHGHNGALFTQENFMSLNKGNPKAALFSRLNELEKFRGDDKRFHFKLCWPEIATTSMTDPPCFEFKQYSNPLDIT